MSEKAKEQYNQIEHICYSRDVVHSYSPGIGTLLNMGLNYIDYCEEQYRAGKNVLWTPGVLESPLVYACDAIPIAIADLGRLGSENAFQVAQDVYQLPTEACGMIKCAFGELYLRRTSGVKRIVQHSGGCEPFNVMYEILKKDGYDIYTVEDGYRPMILSKERYDNLVEEYVAEWREAAKWIGGKPLDDERMRQELKRYNKRCQKARVILNLRLQHPTYMRTLPTMYMLSGTAHCYGNPDMFEEALDQIIEEMSCLKPDEFNEPVVPLIWADGRGQEYGVFQAIDDAGAAVLGWAIENTVEKGFDLTGDPVEAMVKFIVGGYNGGSSRAKCIAIEEQMQKIQAKGIILYGAIGCSASSIDREIQRQYFKDSKVPTISLEGSFQVGPPSGQLLTRVRAFVEMIS